MKWVQWLSQSYVSLVNTKGERRLSSWEAPTQEDHAEKLAFKTHAFFFSFLFWPWLQLWASSPKLTALSHSHPHHSGILCFCFSLTVKTSSCRDCSRGALLSSQPLGCTCVTSVDAYSFLRRYLQWFPSPNTFWILLLDLCLFSVFWLACLPLSVSSGGNAWICESVFLFLHLSSWRTRTCMLMTPKSCPSAWVPGLHT